MKIQNESYLAHYGIQGQRWGVRRYQNEDGSLTAEGKIRYSQSETSLNKRHKLFSDEIDELNGLRKKYNRENKNAKKQGLIDKKEYNLAKKEIKYELKEKKYEHVQKYVDKYGEKDFKSMDDGDLVATGMRVASGLLSLAASARSQSDYFPSNKRLLAEYALAEGGAIATSYASEKAKEAISGTLSKTGRKRLYKKAAKAGYV